MTLICNLLYYLLDSHLKHIMNVLLVKELWVSTALLLISPPPHSYGIYFQVYINQTKHNNINT